MESMEEIFQTLSQREIEHLCSSPTMREAFVFDMAEEYGFLVEEVNNKLDLDIDDIVYFVS